MLSQNDKLYAKICAEKKRSSNFSTEEVKFLLRLVDNKKEVIDSKKTDRTTSEKKVLAWLEIEDEFNAAFEDCRSFKVLKTKYYNLKNSIKRKLPANVSNASNQLNIMQANNNNPIENVQISDDDYNATTDDEDTLYNSNGSDSEIKPHPPLNEHELEAAAKEYVFETLLFGEPKTSTSNTQTNLSKQHECQTQQKSNVRKPSADIWEQVAHKKLKKFDLQINAIEEEHKLRKRKLELEIENIEIENRFKKERYELELELMRQKIQYKNDT